MTKIEANPIYYEYIQEHIKNVQTIWQTILCTPSAMEFVDAPSIICISELIKEHDRSKFSKREFDGYRQWFCPIDNEKKDLNLFNTAWNHHQKHNPHHWEYWVLFNSKQITLLDMPFKYIMKMLCDWSAMSLKFKDTPTEFYNKTLIMLSDWTRDKVKEWLPIFDNIVKGINNAH